MMDYGAALTFSSRLLPYSAIPPNRGQKMTTPVRLKNEVGFHAPGSVNTEERGQFTDSTNSIRAWFLDRGQFFRTEVGCTETKTAQTD